ncbi:unnamed protein product [Discula destructiva]
MYELFATAFVNDADLETASSILSGYGWDSLHKRVYRDLYFAGVNPNHPKGLAKTNSIQGMPPEPDVFAIGLPNFEPPPPAGTRIVEPEWQELSNILKKQSYIVKASYEVSKDRDFANVQPIAANHFDANPGALFWSEMPDPVSIAGGQGLILQRKKIEIHDQLNLPTVLTDNDFRFKSEVVEESHDIYHRESPVEFHLTRTYKLPSTGTGTGQPAATLPPLESLSMVEPGGRWMLKVVAYVFDDQSPDKIKEARDVLTKVVDDLTPVGFAFKSLDRKFFDTQAAVARAPAIQSFGQTQSIVGASGSGA